MSETFRAIRVTKAEGQGKPTVEIVQLGDGDLMPGDVTVAVRHSTVNFKDGLAVTGAAPILRRSPMTPGSISPARWSGRSTRSSSRATWWC